jgi:sugar phosphate isomerase/epimerase
LRSLGIADIAPALVAVRERLGLSLIQVSRLPLEHYTKEGARRLAALLAEAGVRADSVVIVHEGESYGDAESVRRTVGYLPEETLAERLAYSRRCIDFAAALRVRRVTTHMGMLPRERSDPGYARLLQAVRELGDYANSRGVVFALETGQESAQALLAFLEEVPNFSLGINFDPANFVIYGSGDPLQSLVLLRDYVVGVHVKDALPPAAPGQLGREARPGQGQARLAECLNYLAESAYIGSFVIENYLAYGRSLDERLSELALARRFIETALEHYDVV